MLIGAGANAKIQNKDGETALMLASKYNKKYVSVEIVKLLIMAGIGFNFQDKQEIITSVFQWTKEYFSELLTETKHRENLYINSQDEQGWTALMWASMYSTEEIVELLIEAGSNIAIKCVGDYDALRIALISKDESSGVVKMLRNVSSI